MYKVLKYTPIALVSPCRQWKHSDYAIFKTINNIYHVISFKQSSMGRPTLMTPTGPTNRPSYRLTLKGNRVTFNQRELKALYESTAMVRNATADEASNILSKLTNRIEVVDPVADQKVEPVTDQTTSEPAEFTGGYVIAKIESGVPVVDGQLDVYKDEVTAAAAADQLARRFPGTKFATFKATAVYEAHTVSKQDL